MNPEEQQFYKSLMGGAEDAVVAEDSNEPDLSLEEMARNSGVDIEAINKEATKDIQAEAVDQRNIPFSGEGRPEGASSDAAGVGTGVAQGLVDVAQNILNFGVDIADGVENLAASYGVGTGDIVQDSHRIDWSARLGSSEDSLVVRSARGITKYAAPVVATMGAGAGAVAGLAAGAATDLLTLDPKQERLTTMLRDEVPELKNFPIAYAAVNYLSNKPDDTALEGRFKNLVEGLGVAAPIAGIFHGVSKGVAAMRNMGSKAASALELGATKEQALAKAAVPEQIKTPVPEPVTPGTIPEYIDESVMKTVGDSQRINFNNDSVINFVKNFAQENPKEYGELFTPWAKFSELEEGAKNIISNEESLTKLLSWKAGERPLTDFETKAAQYIMRDVNYNILGAAMKAVETGAADDLLHFSNMVETFKYVDDTRMGAGSAAGRALNAHKITADLANIPLKDFHANLAHAGRQELVKKALDAAGGSENVLDMAKTIRAISELSDEKVLAAVKETAKTSGYQKAKSVLDSVAINGMLSSPQTTAANFVGNALTTATASMVDSLTVGVGLIRKTPERMVMSDVSTQLHGQFGAFFEAVSAAGQALKTGRGGPANAIKSEIATQIDSISAAALGVPVHQNAAYKILGKIVDTTGLVVGIPSKINATPDAFWGTMLYRGKVQQEAAMLARSRGLKGQEAADFISDRIKNVTVGMHESAQAFAKENTFATALNPEAWAGKADAIINATPMGNIVFPFFKTGANIIEYGYLHSPLSILVKNSRVRNEIAQGGIAADRAYARATLGGMFLGGAAYMASSGMLTGPETRNWKLKQAFEESGTGWQPDSIKIGDTYVKIDRVDPFSSVLRLGAVLSNLRSFVDAGEYDELAAISMGAIADFMTPEMMVDGYSRFFEAYNEAVRYGADNSGKAAAMFAEVSARLIPYSALQRGIKNLVDPVRGSTAIVTENASFLDQYTERLMNRYKSINPWLSTDLPVQRNLFGEPLLVPDGWGPDMISPFAMTKKGSTKLIEQLNKIAGFSENIGPGSDLPQLEVSMPPRRWSPDRNSGVSIELTPYEYEKLVLYSAGLDPKTGGQGDGPSLRDTMSEVLSTFGDIDSNMSDMQYKKIIGAISKVITDYRSAGQKMMSTDEAVMERWTKAVESSQELKYIDRFQ